MLQSDWLKVGMYISAIYPYMSLLYPYEILIYPCIWHIHGNDGAAPMVKVVRHCLVSFYVI